MILFWTRTAAGISDSMAGERKNHLIVSRAAGMRRPRVGPLLEEVWKIDVAGIELCVMLARLCHLTAGGRRPLQREKEEIVEVGLDSSRWQKPDETGTRVDGKNWHWHVPATFVQRTVESTAIAAYPAAADYLVVGLLICDEAKQFPALWCMHYDRHDKIWNFGWPAIASCRTRSGSAYWDDYGKSPQ
jgi:hypothetical protein